jgi:hypothetical protein
MTYSEAAEVFHAIMAELEVPLDQQSQYVYHYIVQNNLPKTYGSGLLVQIAQKKIDRHFADQK